MYLLFPGRHIVTTQFQDKYIKSVLNGSVSQWSHYLPGNADIDPNSRIDEIIFAITSANKSNSRYNPLPLELRSIILYEFARQWRSELNIRFKIVPIPHYQPTERFAELLLKEIEEQLDNSIKLSPDNAIVLTSTPSVIDEFHGMGYSILTAEYDITSQKYVDTVPANIVQAMGNGEDIDSLPMSESARTVMHDIPDIVETVIRIYNDPILTEQGDLTETRNYATYTETMTAVIEIKYNDIKDFIVPGKIVDEGCADGVLIRRLVKDYPDSDFIGIDLSAEMLARANEYKREGIFGNAFVFFKQRNIATPVSDAQASTADTIICNSTLHELWSYGGKAESVRDYLRDKTKQLRKNGHLVIRDVIGPENGDQIVHLHCNIDDGDNPTEYRHYPVEKLSSWTRFKRFVNDFTPYTLTYEGGIVLGYDFILPLRQAMEYISKMEYTDNWASELHEEFCFWSFSQWKTEIEAAGLMVLPESRSYLNTWRVENRFKGHVALYLTDGVPLDYPVTNMVLACEKRL